VDTPRAPAPGPPGEGSGTTASGNPTGPPRPASGGPPAASAPLPDGDYDAFIVWAEKRDDALVFELTLTTGDDKGALYSIAAAITTEADPIALVGLPCTLTVRDSQPRVRL